MAIAELRVYLDGEAAAADRLASFREVRVDQAIGMAAQAELDVDLVLDDTGQWPMVEERFTQPFRRIRVEVRIGEGAYAALIDGPIVGQRFEMGAGPGESQLTLVVHDDSVLLDQEERVALFEDMAAHEIAQSLIGDAGMDADVEDVSAAGAAYTRYVVQRGTPMQLLRDLARRHGMFVYVKPGDSPGRSVCVFRRPSLAPGDATELLLLGAERNIRKFTAHLDALQPMAARAGSVQLSDKSLLTSESRSPTVDPLGDEGVHAMLSPTAVALLSDVREEQADIDAATEAAVDLSSFAYTATAEVDANDYDRALSPHVVVNIAGPGATLGGAYLVARVHHVFTDGSYVQNLTLKRNARSAGGGAGGLLAGIF
jgi:hypothetical protein